MATTESSRLEMHLKLKSVLGDKVADTMMDHLPPTGWADVARKSDIDHLAALMDARFEAVDTRINGLVQGMWAIAGISLAMWASTMATIITKF